MSRSAPSLTARRGLILAALSLLLGLIACDDEPAEQVAAVESLNDRSHMLQVACLDVNDDGRVDAADADREAIDDVTGDGVVDEADLNVLRAVTVFLPDGRPAACDGRGPQPDWQVTEPPAIDCGAGDRYVLLYGIGGGAVQLDDLHAAAGVRWMLTELSDMLSRVDVPHQLASVAPGINGANNGHAAAENWSVAYLTGQIDLRPCLRLVLLGHSHGGVAVTAIASELEQTGFADAIMFSVLVDRAEPLYTGDTTSLPTRSPVLNFYLPDIEGPHAEAIDQANVENIEATEMQGPADGERGGEPRSITHTTIDNSRDVLTVIQLKVLEALGIGSERER